MTHQIDTKKLENSLDDFYQGEVEKLAVPPQDRRTASYSLVLQISKAAHAWMTKKMSKTGLPDDQTL